MMCPWPQCTGNPALVKQRVRPGSDETETVIPIHNVVGAAAWFGRCPASGILIRRDRSMSATAIRVLFDATAAYGRILAERTRREHAAPKLTRREERWQELSGSDLSRRKVRPDAEEYFPGRPADAPEPGAGERPSTAVPPGVVAVPQTGRSHGMDDMRSQLRAMTSLAIEAFGQAQETTAQMTAAVEVFDRLNVLLADKQQAAHMMTLAAIGSSFNVPDSARQMVASSAAASIAIEDIGAALQLLMQRVNLAYGNLAAAAAAGAEYRAIP